jgi:hypothetical protein
MFQKGIRFLSTTVVALSMIATSNARAENPQSPLHPSQYSDTAKGESAVAAATKLSDVCADSRNSRHSTLSREDASGSRRATDNISAPAYGDTPLHFSIRRN